MGKRTPDLNKGDLFGSWTVISEVPKKKEKHYLCRCTCGTERAVTKSNLRLGKSTSCNRGVCKSLTTTHGLTDHPLYSVWHGIKTRVTNPTGSNACYAGISMTEGWQSFEVFYKWALQAGYQPGLTIDREDRRGDYTPANCRWVDTTIQSQNRSGWKRKEIPYKGVFKTKPRNGKVIYQATGKAPYYWRFSYKGKSHQRWGFTSAEEAFQDKCRFIKKNFDGLVYPE